MPQRFVAAIREGNVREVEQTLRNGTINAIVGAQLPLLWHGPQCITQTQTYAHLLYDWLRRPGPELRNCSKKVTSGNMYACNHIRLVLVLHGRARARVHAAAYAEWLSLCAHKWHRFKSMLASGAHVWDVS